MRGPRAGFKHAPEALSYGPDPDRAGKLSGRRRNGSLGPAFFVG